MNLEQYTVTQIIMAVGLARGLSRKEICRISNSSPAYIVKSLKDKSFNELIVYFKAMPLDKDTKEYKGSGTVYMQIGQLFYQLGEKLNNNE